MTMAKMRDFFWDLGHSYRLPILGIPSGAHTRGAHGSAWEALTGVSWAQILWRCADHAISFEESNESTATD